MECKHVVQHHVTLNRADILGMASQKIGQPIPAGATVDAANRYDSIRKNFLKDATEFVIRWTTPKDAA